MSLLRGYYNLPHGVAFPGCNPQHAGRCAWRAEPCCAQHRIMQATSRPELLAVAELCAQEFTSTSLSEGLAKNGMSQPARWLQWLERALADQGVKELLRRFSELEDRKQAGKREQHRATLRHLNLVNDIKNARSSGQDRYADDLELLLYEARESSRRKRVRWRFKRQSMVFLARTPDQEAQDSERQQEEVGGAAVGAAGVVGCCTLILKVLDAALPPPFPTNQPARLYIGNLVVQNSSRRCGCGTALLQAAEKLGWRWKHREIWLHVDESNTPALEMYRKNGYSVVRRERDPIMPLQQRLLMKKILPQRSAAPAAVQHTEAETQEADAQASRVFVWDRNEP